MIGRAPKTLAGTRDLLSVAQIAIAVIAVALGGGASLWALALATLASVLAFVRPLPVESDPQGARLWTLVVFVALIASAARAFLRFEFLDAGIDFLLLLVVQRFFNRQRTREHLQLLLLGSVLMTIASAINADLNYPLLLAAYLPVVFMGLIANHLLAEGERLGPRVQFELERRGVADLPLLWRAVAQVAAVASISALVVFVVFPRFGVGAFLHGTLSRTATSGFGDEVQLGGFGRIKSDARVVMRMTPVGPMAPVDRLTWHLRGNSFDRYEAGRWSQSQAITGKRVQSDIRLVPMPGARAFQTFAKSRRPVAQRVSEGIFASPRPNESRPQPTVRMLVDLEDIGTEKIFAASEPLAIKLVPRSPIERQNRIYGDPERQLIVPRKQPGPIRYEFVSRVDDPAPAALRGLGDPAVSPEFSPYLRRGKSLSPEVSALAQKITAGRDSRYDKVLAVLDYLAADYSYTLDQPQSARVEAGADPLEGFLFDTHAGHCEYFASAMAVLLREVGVPTRNVNGFYGAHYNELGEFYIVRQADAHSWVEVYFEDFGWVTFDPTPPSGRTAGDDAPLWPGFSNLVEAIRNAYLSNVVGFDLSQQLSFLENMGVEREGLGLRVDWRRLGTLALAGLAGLALLLMLRRKFRRRQRDPLQAIYSDLSARLERQGHRREPSESPLAFARRMTREGEALGVALERFSRAYEDARFSPKALELAQLAELERLAKAVLS